MLTTLLAFAAVRAPRELYDYLSRKDPSYAYSVVRKEGRQTEIRLTSQTWQGIEWKHTLLVQQPSKVRFPGVGILYITGDGPRPGDLAQLGLLTEATGMPVAMLFDIPNQPLWNMKEDDLIAHTFEKYLQTGDATWPLLFPMTKSAIRAMDAVQDATLAGDNPLQSFVVTGASKRGWTTWLVGASGDSRVRGIAPMVIDNLNVPAQMKGQIAEWGKYSDMIQDYTRRGLQAKLDTPKGRHLGQIIDPYSYRDNIRVPTLIVKGANDPYWTVDALDRYWKDLKQPKWVLNVPNAGHTLEGGLPTVIGSVGAFARSLAGEFTMPTQSWRFSEPKTIEKRRVVTVRVQSSHPGFSEVRVWGATSDTLDFRPSKYEVLASVKTPEGTTDPVRGDATIVAPVTADANTAMFAEILYRVDGRTFSLSSPTKVYIRPKPKKGQEAKPPAEPGTPGNSGR